MSEVYPIRCDFCGEDHDSDVYKISGIDFNGERKIVFASVCACDFAYIEDLYIAQQLGLARIEKYVYLGKRDTLDDSIPY